MAVRIKHVKGNVLRLHVPLTVKIKRLIDGEITEEEKDFIPSPYYPTYINLKKDVGLTKSYVAEVEDNVASMQDDGTLTVGEYQVEVKCNDDLGNPYRYMVRAVIEIVDATIDAGIEAGIEFDSEDYTLVGGGVFISYGGGVFEQIQSDWAEELDQARSYIRNKPDLTIYQEKESGKGLSENDFTNEYKAKLDGLVNYDDTELRGVINTKVDKETGKGLSTNDFTNADKQKLDGLENYDDRYIRSVLDEKVDKENGMGLSANDYTDEEKSKLGTLENYDDTAIRAEITATNSHLKSNYYDKNHSYNKDEVNALLAAMQTFSFVYVSTLPPASINTTKKIYLVPSETQVRRNIKDEYITIQNAGVYIWEKIGSTDIDLSNYATITQLNQSIQDAISALATVASTGSYLDLTDKPTIPTQLSQLTSDSTHRTVTDVEKERWDGGSFEQEQSDWNETDNTKSSFIKNKPTIPSEVTESTVAGWGFTKNTGTITGITMNGTSKGTSGVVDIGTVVTDVSGKVDKTTTINGKALSSNVNLSAEDVGALPDTTHIPVVPTNVSAFNNDAGYLTQHQDVSGKEDKVDIVSASGATLTAEVGKYYTLSSVGTLAITLPTIASGNTKVQTVSFYISSGSSPAVTFSSTHSIYYSDGFEIAADSTYEVSALWNGIGWIIGMLKLVASS